MPGVVSVIDPPALGRGHPVYAPITAAKLSPTTTLYTISGQAAEEPHTGSIPDGFVPQINLCLKRLDICLEHIGAKKTDITRFMYYFRQGAIEEYDAEHGEGSALGVIVDICGKWLEGHRPASCYNRSFGMTEDKLVCEFEAMVVLSTE